MRRRRLPLPRMMERTCVWIPHLLSHSLSPSFSLSLPPFFLPSSSLPHAVASVVFAVEGHKESQNRREDDAVPTDRQDGGAPLDLHSMAAGQPEDRAIDGGLTTLPECASTSGSPYADTTMPAVRKSASSLHALEAPTSS